MNWYVIVLNSNSDRDNITGGHSVPTTLMLVMGRASRGPFNRGQLTRYTKSMWKRITLLTRPVVFVSLQGWKGTPTWQAQRLLCSSAASEGERKEKRRVPFRLGTVLILVPVTWGQPGCTTTWARLVSSQGCRTLRPALSQIRNTSRHWWKT